MQAGCAEAPKPPPHTNELLRARETAALTTARLRLSAAPDLDASRPAALKLPLRLLRPCTAEPLTPAAALHPCGLSKVEPNHTQKHRREIARSACNRSRPSSDIERVLSCEPISHRAARTARLAHGLSSAYSHQQTQARVTQQQVVERFDSAWRARSSAVSLNTAGQTRAAQQGIADMCTT